MKGMVKNMNNEKKEYVNLALGAAFMTAASMFTFRLLANAVTVVQYLLQKQTLNTQYYLDNFLWVAPFVVALVVLAGMLYKRRAFAKNTAHPVALLTAGIVAIIYAVLSLGETLPNYYDNLVYLQQIQKQGMENVQSSITMLFQSMIILTALYAVQIVLGVVLILLADGRLRKIFAAETAEADEPESFEEEPVENAELEAFADQNASILSQTESDGETVSETDAEKPADKPAAQPKEDGSVKEEQK